MIGFHTKDTTWPRNVKSNPGRTNNSEFIVGLQKRDTAGNHTQLNQYNNCYTHSMYKSVY